MSTPNHLAVEMGGHRVEFLDKLARVDAMGAEAGPMGGAGVAFPPGAWILNWSVISFFAMTSLAVHFVRGARVRVADDRIHMYCLVWAGIVYLHHEASFHVSCRFASTPARMHRSGSRSPKEQQH